jgi:hypothetical protein
MYVELPLRVPLSAPRFAGDRAQNLKCRSMLTLCTGTMMTKIFHPNVSKAGEICVDTLKKGWKREYGVGHVLVVRNT